MIFIVLIMWFLFGIVLLMTISDKLVYWAGDSTFRSTMFCIIVGPIGWIMGFIIIYANFRTRAEQYIKPITKESDGKN